MSGPERIDVKLATVKESDALLALRGYGFEIVRCREERGPFEAPRQLKRSMELGMQKDLQLRAAARAIYDACYPNEG